MHYFMAKINCITEKGSENVFAVFSKTTCIILIQDENHSNWLVNLGRKEWLQQNFPEIGESSAIIEKFNSSVLSVPETVIQGASRGPIAKIILENISEQFPTGPDTQKSPYSLQGLNVMNREYILRAKVARPVRSSSAMGFK